MAVSISPLPLPDLHEVTVDWPDEVVDLSDRRRILVRAVLGVDLTPAQADAVFAAAQTSPSGSTTRRSGGRSSSTDDT